MAEVTIETMTVASIAAKPPSKRTAAIVPERSVAGRTLVLLIAIMTFLSGVTLGGVVLVQKSAIAWSSDVGRQVTIQIRPMEGEVMDSNIRTANSMAGTLVLSGVLVLVLIVVATVLAVVFATRGTMASNREIVDVLHFIGASNAFIAGEFQGRFLALGFRGGVIGGLGAVLFFFVVAGAAGSLVPDQASAQLGFLFGRFSLGFDGILGIAAVVPVIASLTAITSRLTVRRFLSQTSGL